MNTNSTIDPTSGDSTMGDSTMGDPTTNKCALLSVYDKTGLVELAHVLIRHGFCLVASAGTNDYLQEHNIPVREIRDITGHPPLLKGRIKTLHPSIYTGILSTEDKEDMRDREGHNFLLFDLVVVRPYPFEEHALKSKSHDELLEYIDIGGISLIRAAAKNYKRVGIITHAKQYQTLIDQLETTGQLDDGTRQSFAAAAYMLTSQYDASIAQYFSDRIQSQAHTTKADALVPKTPMLQHQQLSLVKQYDLRYGENPHQNAALYNPINATATFDQKYKKLSGKDLSYNNILDLTHAVSGITHIENQCSLSTQAYVCVGVKHQNICGACVQHEHPKNVLAQCIQCDPVSIFGGILVSNFEIGYDEATIVKNIFLEIIVAPSFSQEALNILKRKKKLILIEYHSNTENSHKHRTDTTVTRHQKHTTLIPIRGTLSYLIQDTNTHVLQKDALQCVTKTPASERETELLLFATAVCSHVKSNAIVLAAYKNSCYSVIGVGSGQMNRIAAVQQACTQAQKSHSDLIEGAVMSSDAFFPMDDSVSYAGDRGIRAVLQPGGSIRDKDSIAACNERGMAMLMSGIRYFLH